VIGTANFEVVEYLKAVIYNTVFVSQVTSEVIEASAVSLSETCTEIKFIFMIVGCFNTETGVDVRYKHLSVKRLELYKQLVHGIRFVVNLLIGNSSFVFAVPLSQGRKRKGQKREQG
jgi:hypothetical protein